jgi:sporulation protein YlmC with PRC-barrel domain
MDIPINADVECAGAVVGRSTYIVLNPDTEKVTHLVVREKAFPHRERLVPVGWVVESNPHRIRLRGTLVELEQQEDFIETEFLAGNPEAALLMWPYEPFAGSAGMVLEHEQVPAGELAVGPGSRVKATDGDVGRLDEFAVEPVHGHITHLVLRKGHLWGQKDVTVPVSQIDRIEDDTVYLKLDRHAVGALPAVPVRG